MTTMDAQLGVKAESTYGTPVTVDRFFEFNTWGVKLNTGRTTSAGLRPGRRTQRADRMEPYRTGASGPFALDVPTKGFGWWLKYMLGTVATGTATDSNYPHTGTEGSLLGDFFTAQVNKPLHPAGTAQPHTYHGGKLLSWELACDVDGVLMLSGELDFEDEDTTTSLATASYPADFRIFSFAGGSVTWDGGAIDIRAFKCGANLGLKTDRRYLRGSSLKKEPTEDAERSYTASFEVDHSDLTMYDAFRAAAAADTYAALEATFEGPVAHGGSTLPSLVVTIPAFRIDQCDFDIQGPGGLIDVISGVGLDNGTDSPMTIVYTTTDATA